MILKEKRVEQRIPINKGFKGITTESFQDFEIVNFSKGGAQLMIKNGTIAERVTPEKAISIRLFYKLRESFGEENLHIKGIVRWRKEIAETFYHKVGVQFSNPDDFLIKKLVKFLHSFSNKQIAKMDCIIG